MIVSGASTDQVRKALAHSLGFANYPENNLAVPYLNYIENRYTGPGTLEDYLHLFTKVVQQFSNVESHPSTIQAYIDTLCASSEPLFCHTQEKAPRKELVSDTVLYILGVWVTALSYFITLGGHRQIELAYCLRQGTDVSHGYHVALKETLPGLMKDSGLFPSPEASDAFPTASPAAAFTSNIHLIQYSHIDSLESASIKARTLNAHTLSILADTRISWTMNLSRHLLLSPLGGHHVLEIFALPCALRGTALIKAGVPAALINEIQASYSILFNPFGGPTRHARLGKVVGVWWWCWCGSCSSRRLRIQAIRKLKGRTTAARRRRTGQNVKSEFDPLLETLAENPDPEDWSYELFPHLWPRIVALEEHLHSTKPWNFWVLFKDRRDTLQFWTFLFGTLILVLTIIQVALGAAQVAGAF